jgi:hypothetical protein
MKTPAEDTYNVNKNTSSSTLRQNSSLLKGESIKSENGAYKLVYQEDGNVCLYSTRNTTCSIWCSMATHTPGRLSMQEDGNLVAYDSRNIAKWSTGTDKKGVGPYKLRVQNDRNVILVDSTNTVLWSTQTTSVTIVDDSAKFAYVSNGVVKFGSWNESKNKNEFSVQYTETTSSCDIDKLKELCTGDCVGFIHSPDSNTWQKITPTSTYKITSTVQDMYLKEYDVNLEDSSCTNSDVEFIDPTLFSNYPQGEDFKSDGKKQCNVLSPIPLPTYTADTTRTTPTYTPITGTLQEQYEYTNDIMKSKTEEYQTLLQQLKKESSTTTLEQQYEDMSVFDKQHKMQLVLWTILTASILAIVLLRK